MIARCQIAAHAAEATTAAVPHSIAAQIRSDTVTAEPSPRAGTRR